MRAKRGVYGSMARRDRNRHLFSRIGCFLPFLHETVAKVKDWVVFDRGDSAGRLNRADRCRMFGSSGPRARPCNVIDNLAAYWITYGTTMVTTNPRIARATSTIVKADSLSSLKVNSLSLLITISFRSYR